MLVMLLISKYTSGDSEKIPEDLPLPTKTLIKDTLNLFDKIQIEVFYKTWLYFSKKNLKQDLN